LDQSYDIYSPTGSFSFKKNNNVGADCALAKTAGFLGKLQRQNLDYILNVWGRPNKEIPLDKKSFQDKRYLYDQNVDI